MAFAKISKQEKNFMRSRGGYREKTVMAHAACFTTFGNGDRYIKVHNRKKEGSSFDTAVFDRKNGRWVN